MSKRGPAVGVRLATSAGSVMMVFNYQHTEAATVIQFHEDHFTYDATRRGFILDEPDTLLGDRLIRVDVIAHRVSRGWEPVTTVKLEDDDALGVIDIWTRTEDPDILEP